MTRGAWWGGFAGLFGATLVAIACGSFSDAPRAPDAAAPADASDESTSTTDAGADGDAGGYVDSGALFEDGFEYGPSCDGWSGANAVLELATDGGAHGGSRYCRVCATSDTAQARRPITVPLTVTRLQLDFWIRAPKNAPWVGEVNRLVDSGAPLTLETTTGTATGEWQHGQITLDAGAGGDIAAYVFRDPRATGDCFDLDDTSLRALP